MLKHGLKKEEKNLSIVALAAWELHNWSQSETKLFKKNLIVVFINSQLSPLYQG